MGQEGMFPVSRFSTRHQVCHLHHTGGILGVGGGDAQRLLAILERGIKPRKRELVFGGIVCQRGDGEDVVAGQFVDEMGNPRDVAGGRPPLLTRERIKNIWSRTRRDNDRAILWDCFIKFWVTRIKGESGRVHLSIFLDHRARELDALLFNNTTVLLE